MKSYLDVLTEDTDISLVNEFIDNFDLTPEQLKATKESVVRKGGIWTVEMGLGKTIITLGVTTLLAPILQDSLTIITAPLKTVLSFYDYVRDCTFLKPVYTTGEFSEVASAIKEVERGAANCIVCTDSIWEKSLEFSIFVYNNLDRIKCMIYDECKGTDNNRGYKNFIAFANTVPYAFPANATPFTSNGYTLYSLLRAVKAVPNELTFQKFMSAYGFKQVVGDVEVKKLDHNLAAKTFANKLINFNRKDIGAEAVYKRFTFHPCEPSSVQTEFLNMKEGKTRNEILYCQPAPHIMPMQVEAFKALINVIMCSDPMSNRIIFCWHQGAAEMIRKVLQGMGIQVIMMNGYASPTAEDKQFAEDLFNETKGAVMVTSCYDGSNLNSAHHLIVYEQPPEINQYIYRAVRGFKSKEIEVDWIYYPQYEIENLIKAYEQAIQNSESLGRSTDLAENIKQEVKKYSPNDVRIN